MKYIALSFFIAIGLAALIMGIYTAVIGHGACILHTITLVFSIIMCGVIITESKKEP